MPTGKATASPATSIAATNRILERLDHSSQAGPRIVTHPSPWAWNTTLPLSRPGSDLLKALEALTVPPSADAELARHAIQGLLICSIRHLEQDSDHPRVQQPAQVWREAVSYLNNHYSDTALTRDRVAEAVGVHPNYLSSLATRESNGFYRALESIRMTQANHLLKQGAWSVKEVAAQCGYTSAAHFSHAYRRVFGFPPREARERMLPRPGRE